MSKCKHDKYNCQECRWLNGYPPDHVFPAFSPPPRNGSCKATEMPKITPNPKSKKK